VNRVLFVAAEKFELRPIPAREGWQFIANGPGPALAGAAVDAVKEHVDVIVSTGLCGALDPVMAVGDIFVATEVNGVPARLPSAAGRFVSGPLVSVDRVITTAAEKRRLFERGARAVEMEAAAVQERARARGAAFYCIRAVSDVAEETFALDLNAARQEDGRFSVWQILGQALRRPSTGIPELIRLRRSAARATKALGEFFADCRF
jgi:uridine phosphorylase